MIVCHCFVSSNQIEDGEEGDDPEEDLDNDVEELLDKLREVTEMFNEKNDSYLRLEEDFEAMKKVWWRRDDE